MLGGLESIIMRIIGLSWQGQQWGILAQRYHFRKIGRPFLNRTVVPDFDRLFRRNGGGASNTIAFSAG
jgi:hypothetical protein